MAALIGINEFSDVYQLESVDWVQGGFGQTSNRQAQQLVNRTTFLKVTLDAFIVNTDTRLNALQLGLGNLSNGVYSEIGELEQKLDNEIAARELAVDNLHGELAAAVGNFNNELAGINDAISDINIELPNKASNERVDELYQLTGADEEDGHMGDEFTYLPNGSDIKDHLTAIDEELVRLADSALKLGYRSLGEYSAGKILYKKGETLETRLPTCVERNGISYGLTEAAGPTLELTNWEADTPYLAPIHGTTSSITHFNEGVHTALHTVIENMKNLIAGVVGKRAVFVPKRQCVLNNKVHPVTDVSNDSYLNVAVDPSTSTVKISKRVSSSPDALPYIFTIADGYDENGTVDYVVKLAPDAELELDTEVALGDFFIGQWNFVYIEVDINDGVAENARFGYDTKIPNYYTDKPSHAAGDATVVGFYHYPIDHSHGGYLRGSPEGEFTKVYRCYVGMFRRGEADNIQVVNSPNLGKYVYNHPTRQTFRTTNHSWQTNWDIRLFDGIMSNHRTFDFYVTIDSLQYGNPAGSKFKLPDLGQNSKMTNFGTTPKMASYSWGIYLTPLEFYTRAKSLRHDFTIMKDWSGADSERRARPPEGYLSIEIERSW